jgi:membrane protein insertase Oxa1/YidC/SpoIIIJ
VTMVLSQKLMVTTPPSDPEQAAIQKQTQQIMPITLTAMFFFMPLPAGVFLYMVFSNIVQTLQTWMLSKQPAAPIIDIDEIDGDGTITVHPKNPDENDQANKALTDKSEKKQSKSGGKDKEGSGDSGKTEDNTGGSTIKLTNDEKQGKKK